MPPRVLITGYGLVTPLGTSVETVWERVCRGDCGIDVISDESLRVYRSQIAGECRDFTMDPYLPSHEAKRIERFAQFAFASAIDAVNMAGIDFAKENRDRCAVVIGTGVGGLMEIEFQFRKLMEKGQSKISPFTIPKIMGNAASGQVSIHYGITGPSYGIVSACATANNAMVDAYKLIQSGDADLVITGGSEAAICTLGVAGFAAMRALSQRNDDPKHSSRPFDKDRDGFVLSEGAGVLIFESEEHAKKRGAKILGELLGYGMNSDATHITQPDQEGKQASKAILETLQRSRLNPEDIQYVNAHGTATELGDVAETAALKNAFGEHAKKLAISSTKSQVGHLLGGSGGVELIFSLLAIRDGLIPPTINLDTPDPRCDLDFTPNKAKEKKIKNIVSNSFGFGGHNVCIAATIPND